MKRWALVAVLAGWLAGGAQTGTTVAAGPPSDPYCTGRYGGAAPLAAGRLRLGIDPGLAGSAGPVQLPAVPDNPARDLAALRALRPSGRQLVVRLNRLFWSDGQAGVRHFAALTRRYARAGFEVEIQVRYHPAPRRAGDLKGWESYVRQVVRALGPIRGVVAMTITNEVNLQVSPNTSDGYYAGARDALIGGIEVAAAQARRLGLGRLRFGFTYAYRSAPNSDAALFSYLGTHGGPAFRHALGFVGLDFYPGTVYPPVMVPGDSYRAELAQAAGTVRECLAPKAGIGASTPIWFTETGVPTGVVTDARQAAALAELVRAARDYSRTFHITDYRWFNLRDTNSSSPAKLIGVTFDSDGLMRSDYSRKPSFAAYRRLIGLLGARSVQ